MFSAVYDPTAKNKNPKHCWWLEVWVLAKIREWERS